MSYVVNAAGKRGPVHFRAAISLTVGCALLGGCSAATDRFLPSSAGNGYEARRPSSRAQAYNSQQGTVQPAAGDPYRAGNVQLASAEPGQPSGYMEASRVDLPPLPERGQTSPGVKSADGYGRYNAPPVADGVYTGPRVFTPYDGPRNDPPPAPPTVYEPGDAPPRYDRIPDRDPPPPPSFYRRSEREAPPYEPRGEARIYEPKPERDHREAPPYRDDRRDYSRGYDRIPERGAYNRAPAGEGKAVTIAPGETLYLLARRYGVTVDMIARANGLSSIYVRPGTTIIIPQAGPTAYAQAPGSGPKTQTAACATEKCHVVKPGETVASIARVYGVPERRLAELNKFANARGLKPGQTISIPEDNQATRQALASAGPQRRDAPGLPLDNKSQPIAPAGPAEKGGRMGTLQDPQPLKPVPDVKSASIQPIQEPTCEAALANPLPRMGNTFRKPVEGKTIAQFGPQRDGTVNEGVTISVPKGTPIKAAENGVVAYVGDELPGFGNLILIRHADEYVTAYAHADTILVKKCDVVKRGQSVATAGATGDASQPQLHFEIRKNSKPVDPSPLLGS